MTSVAHKRRAETQRWGPFDETRRGGRGGNSGNGGNGVIDGDESSSRSVATPIGAGPTAEWAAACVAFGRIMRDRDGCCCGRVLTV
uniref:Uncharacterized protein n=1 Tax=Angiostrongylus cantonensis TaxID=6313 RepID=A0A0K0DPI3_ANGCA